ncbi:MAG: CoA-binding protein [Deltaproteobacteria bacterium]|nr:CoA-binding protein [Deltaproteobacteria bacterium]
MNRKIKYIQTLFNPRSVAVIGASEKPDKLGSHVMKSLLNGGYGGKIIPVNPGAETIMGLPAYPAMAACDSDIDLTIVVLPARLVPDIFRECVQKGVKGIVLITAGFKEIDDPAGDRLHADIARIANEARIPVIGPNTFGMINFHAHLNASFTPEFSQLRSGGIALVSQSGGISHLLGFLAMRSDVGFSKIVGLGNRLNVDFAEMIRYLSDDPDTRVIVLYVEGIDDPAALMQAARAARGKKPIIGYKTGRGSVSDAASRSHTGSLAGSHAVYTHAFTQGGILHIDDSESLLDAAKTLSLSPLPQGSGVAVLSGQAGPSMAACDVCEEHGLHIVSFSDTTQETINALLPPLALRTNPVDMGPAWYNSEAIAGIIRAVMTDPGVDAILLLTMFASANVDVLKGIRHLLMTWNQKKPLLACIQSPPGIWDAEIQELEGAGALVNFPSPERAAMALVNLWRMHRLQTR